MDPKDVKLPIKVKLAVFWKIFKSDHENFFATGAIALLVLASLGMALCVPSFMAGPISQFFMTIIFAFLFGGAFLGMGIIVMKFHEEEFEPWFSKIHNKYKEDILPLQKAEIEKVDDILLR